MNFFKKHISKISITALFVTIIAVLVLVAYFTLNRWEKRIIEENKIATELSVRRLSRDASKILKDLDTESFFSPNVTKNRLKELDTTLKVVTHNVLKDYKKFKGGFYLVNAEEFIGYAFPDTKPPIPAYGPPPRSYHPIKGQTILSAKENEILVKLYKFDPDIFFALATKPIVVNDKIEIVAWTRTHIEEKLPKNKLKRIITFIALFSLFFLTILIYFSIKIRTDILKINQQLDNVQSDPNFRLKPKKGIFGYIINAVNDTLERLQKVNFKRRELEKQLHQKDKMASLGRISAGIAHEVKTPLAIIKTRIQMWQMKAKGGDNDRLNTEDSMNLVTNEIDRLSRLVNRLLIFARPINKKLSSSDINHMVKDVVFMMQMREDTTQINFNTDYSEDIPLVEADENSLKQVLINVISNSIEAISGKGAIFVKTKYLESEGLLRIEIDDTGKNVSNEILNNIFEPFFTTKEKGVGLGLAISYEIIKAHNGIIRFKNRIKEKGVKCIIELPVKQKKTN